MKLKWRECISKPAGKQEKKPRRIISTFLPLKLKALSGNIKFQKPQLGFPNFWKIARVLLSFHILPCFSYRSLDDRGTKYRTTHPYGPVEEENRILVGTRASKGTQLKNIIYKIKQINTQTPKKQIDTTMDDLADEATPS